MNFVSSDQGNLSDPMRLSDSQSITRKLQVVTRSVLLYGFVAPKPIEAVSEKPPFPTIDLKTYDVRTKRSPLTKGSPASPLRVGCSCWQADSYSSSETSAPPNIPR
jgi:hypothetical protein